MINDIFRSPCYSDCVAIIVANPPGCIDHYEQSLLRYDTATREAKSATS